MDTLFLKSIKKAIKNWYIPLLVGVLFVIISIVAFTAPLSSLLTLAILFAMSFLFGGISEIIFSLINRDQLDNWGWTLGFGIITFIVGILLLINPALSVSTLAFYVGFIILFRSIAAISLALDIKEYGSTNWGALLGLGILGAIFSFILIWNPLFAGMSVVLLVGLSFLFAGLFSIYFSLQLKKLHKHTKTISSELRQRYEALSEEIRREWNNQ
ncbi:HdeD family acid-resistance protein [Arenibacter certesii]|uniref:HdeD family acid-resistance protein n=1 Tax=Arenibacter certesii TaxID=228955 RepID=A0A918MI85_9FLAO|nr:DUF308 domain-containing protein [Arenibacter certesii]GGW28550.1 hypothetical protein GCM10007383_12400 [Arenibacter certesii]